MTLWHLLLGINLLTPAMTGIAEGRQGGFLAGVLGGGIGLLMGAIMTFSLHRVAFRVWERILNRENIRPVVAGLFAGSVYVLALAGALAGGATVQAVMSWLFQVQHA